MSPYGGLSLRGGIAALPRVGNWKKIGIGDKFMYIFIANKRLSKN